MSKEPRVLVLMPTAMHTERKKLRGLLSYACEQGGRRWRIHLDLENRMLTQGAEAFSRSFDGIIGYVERAADQRRLFRLGLPAVVFNPNLACPSQTKVPGHAVLATANYSAEGETAAQYFRARRFHDVAFIDEPRATRWGRARERAFRETSERGGLACHVYRLTAPAQDFTREFHQIVRWLEGLPKPCGIYAVHDLRARQVLLAAHEAGISVPGEISVLGTDNDELICDTATPPLSSVDSEDFRLGQDLAAALDGLFNGRAHPRILVTEHRKVVERKSTAFDAIADEIVAQVIQHARTHLNADLSITALAKQIHYSPRQLQSRARRALGVPLGTEIRKLRLRNALDLLSTTNDPVTEIADVCGYTGVSHLCMTVRSAVGESPLAYRKRFRRS